MGQKENKGSGNELLRGKCMTFSECMTCTDVQHCKIEIRQKGVDR